VIDDLNALGDQGYGVYLRDTNISLMYNNTIQTNGTNHSQGIRGEMSSLIDIELNTITANGTGKNNSAISIRNSRLITISNNTLATSGPEGHNNGAGFTGVTANVTIMNNTMRLTSTSPTGSDRGTGGGGCVS